MNYETVIGLETHVELSTKTKIYCSCPNEFGGAENTHCCPVCVGLPGALPVLNKSVVDYAVLAGLALHCKIETFSKQDRKSYFYPDLAKAYQISQFDLPLCYDGYLDIEVGGETKRIGITRIHIEEDAGKLVHSESGSFSRVDYNRAGVPLIEIVTEPDFRSSEEAYAYLETLKNILEYIGVSDCKMQEGSLRCDVNVSIRPEGQMEFGVRSEMKNVSSFRGVARGIEYEKARQIALAQAGEAIVQETRRWDDVKGESVALRSKEEAQDYRYFPEPDLLPIKVSDDWVCDMEKKLPELPAQKKARYIAEYQLPEYDAGLISATRSMAAFFEECVKLGATPKTAANWIMGDVSKKLNEKAQPFDAMPFGPDYLVSLISLIEKKTITNTIAKQVLDIMFEEIKDPETIVKEQGLAQISNTDEIEALVREVLAENPQSIIDYKAGKDRAMGFLTGQAMRKSKGKGNPQLINELLLKFLNE